MNMNEDKAYYTVKDLRALWNLDAGQMFVADYARRPKCARCNLSVVGHSYHHLANGVICHVCLFGVKRCEVKLERPKRRALYVR